ncbi:MAG TPA: glycoside hydrolase family 13 protein, partial [Rubrivivax sp.]|nr:glycoside hydrolase family 13 protein [Rubrivivax sp.]
MNRGPRSAPRALLLAAAAVMSSHNGQAQPAASISAPQAACFGDPLRGRALYLRGTFNSWGAAESQRFTWLCNRWELVTPIKAGEHSFKAGDEGWSPDADFGTGTGASSLVRKGAEIKRRFGNFTGGVHRFTLTMTDPTASPQLQVEACPVPAPLGDTILFLRGSMNNWAALDDYAFQYSCDAYYLNIKAHGRHEFKIADAGWKATSSFSQGGANFEQVFSGEHTLRLVLEGGVPKLTVGAKTFADPRAAAVKDPVALSLRFDSRSAVHKQPFGAVTAGSTVHFAVTAAAGVDRLTLVVEKRRLEGNQEVLAYQEVARVPLVRSGAVWQASHRFADVSIYGYWFEAQIGERAFALHNNADTVFWTREKGSGGHASVAELMPARSTDKAASNTAAKGSEEAAKKAAEKAANTSHIRRFRQTVYAPDFKVPDWAADAVYYYVFPDRFRNGDKGNDPRPGRARYHKHTVERHARWTDKPFRPGSGDGSDAIYNNDFFGGDLQGLISKLDYIKDLGANTIYMTPVFKAASNHKYDTADYRQIDPAFGSNADFERLCKEAAKRGIRVVPDTSLNHTGSDSMYFNRFGNYPAGGAFDGGRVNARSPYADWYTFDTAQRDPDKQYTGWVDVKDLPELNKASTSFRNFAYRDKDSVMKLWLDRGAAGWRMDVAPWVPDDFWREWRAAIKAHRPDALTVAETWFDASKYFLGDMFDSTMNYIFRNAVLDYAAGGNAAELYRNIELTREAYPPQAFHALMNLLSTHDQARALHHFGWSDEHGNRHDVAAAALAKQRLRLALLFQMTFPGAPSVYYGDEVGVTGGDDPYNRATYPWADEGGEPDHALLGEFKRLISLRNDHAVLRRGSLAAPLLADEHVIVLARQLGEQWAITATNNAAA